MWTPERIVALRKRFGETQEEFAKRFRVNVWTLRYWEQGRGEPIGPATVLLDILNEQTEQLQPA